MEDEGKEYTVIRDNEHAYELLDLFSQETNAPKESGSAGIGNAGGEGEKGRKGEVHSGTKNRRIMRMRVKDTS